MTRYVDCPWWEKQGDLHPHQRLMPIIAEIREQQAARYERMRKFIDVYEYGFAGENAEDEDLHFNAAKNAIDTMYSALITPRIAPMVLTQGGTWSQRDRAKKATRCLEGTLDDCNVEEIDEDISLDGLLAYCGFAHVWSEVYEEDGVKYGEIRVDRVMPDEIGVDDAEGIYRTPQCMYRWKRYDKYKLLAEYGVPDDDLYGAVADRKRAIKRSTAAPAMGGEANQSLTQIEVFEAWHLPSGPRKKDGMHVIVVENGTLYAKPWTRASFPIIEFRPEKARKGFWGLSAMQQCMAGQREFEEFTRKLQRSHARLGGSMLLVGGNAGISEEEMSGAQGVYLKATGDIGQIRELTPSPANPQTYQFRDQIAGDILRYLGVSQFAAQSEIPSGLQQASGKALQKFEDTNDKRGVGRHRARERWKVQLCRAIIEEARARIKDDVKMVARYRDKRGFEVIDWKDVIDVFEDQKNYVIKIFPVGMLSQDPSAKFAQLDSLLERQVINVEQFKRLFEIPDLEAENEIDCADYEIIDKNLDYIVTTGKYVDVQPFDDWGLIVERGGKFYNHCRVAGVPPARLDLLRRYIVDAQDLIDAQKRKEQEAAASMAPPPMDPSMGAPMNDMAPPPPMGDAMPLPIAS